MKKIANLFCVFFLLSCSKDKNIEIKILNNELISFSEIKNVNDLLFDTIYDHKSLNIIKYSISNNSNEKYFIHFDDQGFLTSETDSYFQNKITNGGMCFNLYNEDRIMSGKYYNSGHSSYDIETYYADYRNWNGIINEINHKKNLRRKIVSEDFSVTKIKR